MRVPWKVTAVTGLVGSVLVGCTPTASTVVVRYEQFRFTCCLNAGALTHIWHPGQVITLQWSAESTGMTADDSQVPITLTAVVTGPFGSVAALKSGGTHALTLVASPMHVTDRTSGGVISTIPLPLDIAAGWYNLATTSRSAGGSLGGGTVIHVTTSGS